MSTTSWLMAGYPPVDAPLTRRAERQISKPKLQNFWFVMRNASVEAAQNVEKFTDGAHELLAWPDADQHASKQEFEPEH